MKGYNGREQVFINTRLSPQKDEYRVVWEIDEDKTRLGYTNEMTTAETLQ